MRGDLTARRRELAASLTKYRTATGWTPEQFARRLGWPVEKCALVEDGGWVPTELDVLAFLTECGLPAATRRAVLDLLDGDTGGWVRPHGDGLPEAAPGVLLQHKLASTIICYDPAEIPVMFQDIDYVSEDLRRRFGPRQDIDRHEDARGEYRSLLHDKREIVAYLHESVLRSVQVSKPTRWRLHSDLTEAIDEDRAEVRIIPAAAEPGLRMPTFTLLRFHGHDPLVCHPCETVTVLLEGEHTSAYQSFADQLDEIALSTAESRALVVELAGGQEALDLPPAEAVEDLVAEDYPWDPELMTEAVAALHEKRAAAAAVADRDVG